MNAYTGMSKRRFYRDADRAKLGGVCAGIADYFGFNLCATRFLAVIAFLMAMPMFVIAYIAAVLLVPARSLRDSAPDADPEFKRALRSSPQRTMNDVRRRFQTLDRRLARLEKYVTSSRFQLDQEFKRL
jgi:phage shock protein C